jgi:hypothetical protein
LTLRHWSATIFLALFLNGCSGSGFTTSPTPSNPTSSIAPSIAASSTQPLPLSPSVPLSPISTLATNQIWQIGNAWTYANSGECGSISFPTKTSATLTARRSGTSCMREQLNPSPSTLTYGRTYTWKFQTVPHMGKDAKLTQRLIWQLHDLNSSSSPITTLGIENMAGTQVWYFTSCGNSSPIWTGAYTEGGTDTWQITAVPASGSNGRASLYRNGILL